MEEMKRNHEAIARCIREAQTIAVVSHVNPDGDTIGSTTAMRLILNALGKDVTLFCDGKVPDMLSFLPGQELFQYIDEDGVQRHAPGGEKRGFAHKKASISMEEVAMILLSASVGQGGRRIRHRGTKTFLRPAATSYPSGT